MKLAAALLAAAALATACASTPGGGADPFPGLPQGRVLAVTASGSHTFDVWIAADAKSRERGLMHVRHLPADRGMFFVFEFPQEVAFWMKDTVLSLDLIFVGEDHRVVRVAAGATPYALTPIESGGETRSVLEVIAGTAARIGLKPGDRVVLLPKPDPGGESGS